MNLDFLFWLFLFGLIVGSLQDLKRREADNWLTLFLLVSGFSYLFFSKIFSGNYENLLYACVVLVILFFLTNVLFYSRAYGGGDMKFLIAMSVIFVGESLASTLANLGIFMLLFFSVGAVWALGWGGFVFFRKWKESKKEFVLEFRKNYLRYFVLAGIGFFVLSYFNFIFLFFAVMFLIFPILFVFAKVVDKKMTNRISPDRLQEGDFLVDDLKIGKKILKANWQGLSEKEILLLKKRKKKVLIKWGVPFIPGILISFLVYYFFRFVGISYFLRVFGF